MDVDPQFDKALLENAEAAALRWKHRKSVREARTSAIKRNAPLQADAPARVAARLNNLIDDVRRRTQGRRSPANPVLKSLVERPMPVTVEELNEDLVNEVVIGARDFLSVEFLERGVLATRSVGRVVLRTAAGVRARGTGFMVARNLMITNEHVLPSADIARNCAIEMDYEQNRFGPARRPQVFGFAPDSFFLNDKALDYALIAVEPVSDFGNELGDYGWLPLNGALGKISISDKDSVNVVQHPLGREKEVVIRNNRVLDMRTADDTAAEELGAFLHYEADTEKGSSGSPVLNDSWEVVGLHHSGVPATNKNGDWLDKSGGVWRSSEQPVENLQWVANEALRISSLVAALAIADLPADKRRFLDEAMSAQVPLALGERTVAEEAAAGREAITEAPAEASKTGRSLPDVAGGSAAPQPAMKAGDGITFEVPVRITISLGGQPVSARGPAVSSAGVVVQEDIAEGAVASFADRAGYASRFLGVDVPLPVVKPEPKFGGLLKIARPARPDDPYELRYHNFSVMMCAARALAYVSACNVDFAAAANAGRTQGRDSWRLDPRIDPAQQLGRRFYDHNDYDKGHLARRDDVAWGDSVAEAIAASEDSFHYTNAAPQHFLFNQPSGGARGVLDLWGDLENHISRQGGAQRARLTIFNGPVFGHADKPLLGALVPLRFFKIVIWKDGDSGPGAVGFVLDQAALVASLPEEAIDPGRFSIRQRRIADIEAELDIGFGPVSAWDRLAAVTPEEALDGEGVTISRIEDIRL